MRIELAHLIPILVLFTSASHASIIISEVMYDPPVNESYDEWVEIYNAANETISIENWTICNVSMFKGFVNQSDGKTYSNTTFDIPSKSYAVISDGGTGTLAYNHYNISGLAYHTNASTICGGLSNNNGTITIGNTSNVFSIFYNSSIGGSNNNRTLCVYPESNSALQECIASPGYANKKTSAFSIAYYSSIYVGRNSTILNISSDSCTNALLFYNLTNSTYQISNNISYEMLCNETISYIPSSEGNSTLCWNLIAHENYTGCSNILFLSQDTKCSPTLKITTPLFANATQQFTYFIEINETTCKNPNNITVEYWIEDLFGNIIKEMAETTQQVTCYKSVSREWTPPSLNGSESFLIATRISNASCNYSSFQYLHPISVKGFEQNRLSEITILGHESSAKFGTIVNLDVHVYKGDTNKQLIEIWSEKDGKKSSEVTSMYLHEKYRSYRVKIPVQLKTNCDSNLALGLHKINVSGLDQVSQSAINLESNQNCPNITQSTGQAQSNTQTRIKEDMLEIEIENFNEKVIAGSSFKNTIKISGKGIEGNFSVYSYIFRGNELASEGGWIPNPLNLTINSSENFTLSLSNRIKEDISGLYYYRIRMKGNKTYDKTLEVLIEKQQINISARSDWPESVFNNSKVSEPTENISEKPELPVTGMITRSFSTENAIEYILNLQFFFLKVFQFQ